MASTSRRAAFELGCLALIVAAAAIVYTRSLHTALNYDEGNYLASLDALRHGQALGRDVFLDQPPGWYLLLQGLAVPFGATVSGIRIGLMLVALGGLVAAWAAARALAGPVGGLAAAALLAVAPPYPTLAASVESDPPSAVLALCALALALYAYRRETKTRLAVAVGVVLALAVSVKLFAIVAALPIAAIVLRRRSVRDAALPLAGFAAVVVAFAIGYLHVLHQVWQGVFGAHLNARGGHQPNGVSNLSRIVHLPDLHTPFGVLAWAGIAAALVWLARRRPLALWPLWLFTAGAALFTLEMKPLLDHHLVLLTTALAVPAGAALGATLERLQRFAPLLLVPAVAAGLYQEHRRLARNDVPERPSYQWAARIVAANSTPAELVVSDIPSVPFLAGRRQPGQLIDTSIARIVDAYLKPRDVLRLIDASHAPLVVVGRNFRSQPAIVRGIAARYPRTLRNGDVTIYLRAR